MKKKLLLLGAATGVAIIAYAEITPAQKPPTPPAADISKMQDDIKRLQAKAEMLELRTKSLESQVRTIEAVSYPGATIF